MTVRRTIATLGATAVLLLSTTACSSGDDANRAACDGKTEVLSQINQDVTAAGDDQAAIAEAYTTAADTLDDLAATEGIDSELADQLAAGAERARVEASGEDDDVTEPDRTIREASNICDDLLG